MLPIVGVVLMFCFAYFSVLSVPLMMTIWVICALFAIFSTLGVMSMAFEISTDSSAKLSENEEHDKQLKSIIRNAVFANRNSTIFDVVVSHIAHAAIGYFMLSLFWVPLFLIICASISVLLIVGGLKAIELHHGEKE